MSDALALVLGFSGFVFVLSAAVGALRFPDVFTRMHAITKAGTMGVGLIYAGVALHFADDVSLVTRALAVVLFALLTAPASAQMIGRAAYLSGVERAPETHVDQLAERYPDPRRLFEAGPDDVEDVPEHH